MSLTHAATLTLPAATALEEGRRVKITTVSGENRWTYAGAGEAFDAVTTRAVASGTPCEAELWDNGGTYRLSFAGTASVGATVYGAANGQVSTTVAGDPLGYVAQGNAGLGVTASNAFGEVIPLGKASLLNAPMTFSRTANSTDATNGYVEFDPGITFSTLVVVATHARSSAGVVRTVANVTNPAGTTVRVTVTSLANNDIVTFTCRRTAQA